MDNIKDVEFEEVDNSSEEKTIRGSALYYNTGQVAKILGENESKIRYYTKVFDELLDIEVINKQRKYKKEDIDKLRFIIELKDEGMSIKQIQEYTQNVSFNEEEGIQISPNNPLGIQALAKALLEEQEKQIQAMEDRIVQRMQEHMQSQVSMTERMIDTLKEEVATTVDQTISDKLGEFNEVNVNEFKRVSEELNKVNEKLDKIAYVSAEEINKQKKDAPNRFWRWFTRGE